jgi:hypothetical protein
LFLRTRPVFLLLSQPTCSRRGPRAFLSLTGGAHPTGLSLHLLLTRRPTDARLCRAGPLLAARTPPPCSSTWHPPPPDRTPLPPLPQRTEPGSRSFSSPPMRRHWTHNPKSSATALLNLGPQIIPPSLPRSHSIVSLVHCANRSRRWAHEARSIRRSAAAASSAPSPSAAVPREPPSSSHCRTSLPSSTRACVAALGASCRPSGPSHRATARAPGAVTGRGRAHHTSGMGRIGHFNLGLDRGRPRCLGRGPGSEWATVRPVRRLPRRKAEAMGRIRPMRSLLLFFFVFI